MTQTAAIVIVVAFASQIAKADGGRADPRRTGAARPGFDEQYAYQNRLNSTSCLWRAAGTDEPSPGRV